MLRNMQTTQPDMTSSWLSRSELRERLTAVMRFTVDHLSRLSEYNAFLGGDENAIIRIKDKIVAETAILVLLAARVPRPTLGPELVDLIEETAGLLSTLGRCERYRIMLLRNPRSAQVLGLAHAVLTKIGRRDEELQTIVRACLANGSMDTAEKMPFRMMEDRWFRSLAEPAASATFDDLLPHSIVHSDAHPITMSREDATR
jgi:hypothetical protein